MQMTVYICISLQDDAAGWLARLELLADHEIAFLYDVFSSVLYQHVCSPTVVCFITAGVS